MSGLRNFVKLCIAVSLFMMEKFFLMQYNIGYLIYLVKDRVFVDQVYDRDYDTVKDQE